MKRELKFRAWDEHLGLMINPYCELKDGRFWGEDCTNTGYSVKHEHVMQYTGLKDKNGKEIYEGDIVCREYNRGEMKVNQRIEWTGFHYQCIGKVSDGIEGFGFMEVIGNIYENSELLEH
jgi:hypothetical protein